MKRYIKCSSEDFELISQKVSGYYAKYVYSTPDGCEVHIETVESNNLDHKFAYEIYDNSSSTAVDVGYCTTINDALEIATKYI